MKKIIPVALACFTLLAGCSKDEPDHTYNSHVTDPTLDAIYTDLAPAAKKYAVSVSSGGSVRAQGGTRFIFPANAYQDASGKAVTGVIDVEVNDWLTRGDMLFGKMLPMSGGEALISGGQAYVNATQGGKPVFLKPGSNVTINVPQFGPPEPGMLLFVGRAVQTAMNSVEWQLPLMDSAKTTLVYNGDTLSMFPDSFGFFNCDKFYANTAPKPTFTLKGAATEGKTPENMVAYALYRDMRGILYLGNLKVPGNLINTIPLLPVHIAVLGTSGGKFYGGIVEIAPQNGQSYTVQLEQTEPQTFKARLNLL